MRTRLQDGDVLARMDGDEFLLILARDDWDDAGQDLAAELDRLHGVLDVPFTVGQHRTTVGMSMGVAFVRDDAVDHHTVLQACDDALHRLKRDRAGRTRWWQFSDDGFAPAIAVPARPPVHHAGPSLPAPRDIRRALATGGVEPHFQPVVDLRDGTVHLLEALARLRLDDGSLAQPSEFLSQLTRADEKLLFREMLHGALSALHAWDIAGHRENVSINISPVVLRDPTTPGVVYAALTTHGIAPSRLTLEILESQILDLDTQRAAIEELVSIGVTLAMDDLAAGHSSLQRLASFPFSALKLDRGLFDGVHERPLETLSIIATLIQVGRDLSMGVVVEGLEQEDLTEAAIILGAPLGQGYFFARPLPAEQCQAWMAEFSLTLHQSPIQTLLGALAYHWQFGRLNVTHPLPLDVCPLTRFIRQLDPAPDVERWHERQHQGQGSHPASSRALIAWLTQEIRGQTAAVN